ncbi:c-type cytochrome [Campylobacter sp. faydin G-24]|uniref:C-type cytochrome n=1 Tax=Campylobacter anatolicus TaxID=2829105 RepID=A0ABS5HJT8_9BACT|nr:cytochrome c peroxidase [Campylobacter anatolicus]MBR8464508.1 c-type cytochrome [Campylobacter anatolicus]
MRALVFLTIFAIATFAVNSSFTPVVAVEYNEQRALIGKKLFFDKRLSKNANYSCETCHSLYWDFSGTNKKLNSTNTLNPPSVLNAALNYIFYSDGHIRDIYDQVEESIRSQKELNSDEAKIVAIISSIEEYKILFKKAYDDGVSYKNIVDAFVQFEKAIATVNSPFDRYLLGDENALDSDQKAGYELFNELGCIACHNGKNLGANLMQTLTFSKDILSGIDSEGYFNKSKLRRAQSLRNILRTAPYLNDGSVASLKDALLDISESQLMHKLSDKEIELLYNFLGSLNGEPPRIINGSQKD